LSEEASKTTTNDGASWHTGSSDRTCKKKTSEVVDKNQTGVLVQSSNHIRRSSKVIHSVKKREDDCLNSQSSNSSRAPGGGAGKADSVSEQLPVCQVDKNEPMIHGSVVEQSDCILADPVDQVDHAVVDQCETESSQATGSQLEKVSILGIDDVGDTVRSSSILAGFDSVCSSQKSFIAVSDCGPDFPKTSQSGSIVTESMAKGHTNVANMSEDDCLNTQSSNSSRAPGGGSSSILAGFDSVCSSQKVGKALLMFTSSYRNWSVKFVCLAVRVNHRSVTCQWLLISGI
jgi:hypothetical protein